MTHTRSRFVGAPPVRTKTISAGQVGLLVPVHLEAFAEFKNALLGERYARAFLTWFSTDSEAIAVCASIDDRPVGYVVGARVGYQKRLNAELAPVVARCLAARPMLLADPRMISALWSRLGIVVRGKSANSTGLRELAAPSYSLVGLGVSTAARGMGVGRVLVRTFELEVQQRGGRSMRLSVLAENRAACRLYSRCGWNLDGAVDTDLLRYSKSLESGPASTEPALIKH